MPAPDWRPAIRERARAAGIELPLATVDELAAHLDDLYAAACHAGAADDEALRAAMAALDEGGFAALVPRRPRSGHTARRPSHEISGASSARVPMFWYALRIAFRQFRHHAAFALATVAVLGLTTGAATTVYTIVDGVVLRPLPYLAPDRLVMIWDTNHEKGLRHELISPVNFMDYRALHVFDDAAAWWRPDVNLTDPGLDPVRIKTIETSANLFRVLGISPQLGAGFPKSDALNSSELVCVISDRLWRTRYSSDATILGRQLRLNNTGYAVVGVMPPGFTFPDDIDVWERLRWDLTQHDRAAHFMEGVARLAPGTTLAQAASDSRALGDRLAVEHSATNTAWNVSLVPLLNEQLGYYRPALFVLFGAVGLLLVIGCLNVTALMLTRALAREREVAVRCALGASPRHLITQLLAESLVLSSAGGVIGTLSAAAAVPLIVRLSPVNVPRLREATVDPHVLAFSLGIVIVTTLVFGLVPGVALLRRHLMPRLREGERGTPRATRGWYHAILIGEVALASALLVSSTLLVRTVQQMTRVRLGIDADGATIASVQISTRTAKDFVRVAQVYASIIERLREQPGVVAAGASNFLPLEPGWRVPVLVYGQPPPARPDVAPQAQLHTVSDGYFETMGAATRAGRLFTPHDTVGAPGVVVVNEMFARRYLPPTAVGSRIVNPAIGIGPLGLNLLASVAHDESGSAPRLTFEVVGVVGDVRNAPLGQELEPAVYFTCRQFPFGAMHLAVRASSQAEGRAAIAGALRDIAPEVPLGDVSTWGDRFRARTAEPRLLMSVLGFFAALAALLAALGVYGLFSWLVALRRREFAIRLTLGARPVRVGATVVGQSVALVIGGVTVGILIVRLAGRLLAQVLFGVQAGDVPSTAAAAGLLLVTALTACAIPAVRAASTNVAEALRAE